MTPRPEETPAAPLPLDEPAGSDRPGRSTGGPPGRASASLPEAEVADLPRLLAAETRPVLLLVDEPARADRAADEAARSLGLPASRAWGNEVPPGGGYEWALAALRRAVHVRVQTLAKVLEGRIDALEFQMAPNPLAPLRAEPRSASLVLSTDRDSRRLQLEGAFAVRLWRAGARVGDIVQIDRAGVRVSVRHDRERSEGWVQEEREFVHTESLRERDRAAAGVGGVLLGTGHEPRIPEETLRSVDEAVRREVAAGGATLLPGLLLVHDAHDLPAEALVALRQAARSDAGPLLVLCVPDGTHLSRLTASFPQAVLLRA